MPREKLHICLELEHEGTIRIPSAIAGCVENADGTLVVIGSANQFLCPAQSQVSFCPYCGFKATQPLVKVVKT